MTKDDAETLERRSSSFFALLFALSDAATALISSSADFEALALAGRSSSLGATNASWRFLLFSVLASFCFCNFSYAAFLSLASLDKKYSPDSICLSILLITGAGGNTARSFLPIFAGFLRCTFFFLNFGKKRSQLCVESSGSFSNSRLIMSSLI